MPPHSASSGLPNATCTRSAERMSAFVASVIAFQLDAVAYHDGRDSSSTEPPTAWAVRTSEVVSGLRRLLSEPHSPLRPVYLQEPTRFSADGETRPDSDSRHGSYGRAAALAKAAGAAAWTFHTPAGFALDSPTPLEAKDGAAGLLQEGERSVLDSLRAQVDSVAWGISYPVAGNPGRKAATGGPVAARYPTADADATPRRARR